MQFHVLRHICDSVYIEKYGNYFVEIISRRLFWLPWNSREIQNFPCTAKWSHRDCRGLNLILPKRLWPSKNQHREERNFGLYSYISVAITGLEYQRFIIFIRHLYKNNSSVLLLLHDLLSRLFYLALVALTEPAASRNGKTTRRIPSIAIRHTFPNPLGRCVFISCNWVDVRQKQIKPQK